MCMESCWQKILQDSQTLVGVNDAEPDLAMCFTQSVLPQERASGMAEL